MKKILRSREYRYYLFSIGASAIATNLLTLTIYWYVLKTTESIKALALTGFLQSLPILLTFMFSILVKNFGAKKMMLASDIVRAIVAIILLINAICWQSVVLVMFINVVNETAELIHTSATTSFIPSIVEEDQITKRRYALLKWRKLVRMVLIQCFLLWYRLSLVFKKSGYINKIIIAASTPPNIIRKISVCQKQVSNMVDEMIANVMTKVDIKDEKVYESLYEYYYPIMTADFKMFNSCSEFNVKSNAKATIIYAIDDKNVDLKCSLNWMYFFDELRIIRVEGGHMFINEETNLEELFSELESI